MKVHINTQVKNERFLLEKVLPFWQEYPVDEFVFFNDHSSDKTEEVIDDFLGDEAKIFSAGEDKVSKLHITSDYNEPSNRSVMYEYSKNQGADIVISIDADELLSHSFLLSFDWIMEQSLRSRVCIYQYNVVGSLSKIRQDPEYIGNYRDFVIPVNHSESYNTTLSQNLLNSLHESPRVPLINLPTVLLPKSCGFIHLQALNKKFYVLKQLFYKVFEYKEYGKTPAQLLNIYDKVVNGLDFCEIDTPKEIIGDWKFDASVFDKILEERKYIEYIKEHGVDELITFGGEYL
jgi:glycosyltransferase involved in cell wall biosynthesis